MDKKNLDEYFREKFKTFREVPDEKVWTAIENSLDKKRKWGIVPLWWQLGGLAAVLAIALITFYTLNYSGDEPPTITNTEKTNTNDTKQDGLDTGTKQDQKDALQIQEATEDAVAKGSKDVDSNNAEQYTNPKADKDSFPDKLRSAGISNTEATSPKNKIEKDFSNRALEKTQLSSNLPNSDREIADGEHTKEDNDTIRKKDKTNLISEGERGAFVVADMDTSKKSDTSKTDSSIKTQDGTVATQETPKIISEEPDRAIAQNDQIDKDDPKAGDNKKSIFEALEEQAEEEKIAGESTSRWSAGPNVAPVYFNAMGEGSPIDPGFSPNAKSGSTKMSYGLSIAYAVTKQLSVRSGIYKAEYGYNTNNVGFSPTLAASTSGRLQNIDYAGSSENLAVNNTVSDQDSPGSTASEFSNINASRDGRVAQQFGYLEVPLELDYALIDRRFGVNLVGGISSLFLINNSVTLSSGELTTEIGEARNLNDLNFSTNIGFGVNYKFTPKVQLNIEPVFKYQLNTFSNVSGDFRPFSIGVYSGLNFKF